MLLFCVFLVCCAGEKGESTATKAETSSASTIPLPNGNTVVEPNVAKLFQKTVSSLQADKENPKLWLAHGSALFANTYYHESAAAFRQAITLNPEMPQATYLMATALWKVNRQEEAISAMRTAMALIPEYDMGWRLLAEWQLERGETAKAEASARKAFELNPARVGTRYILAQSLMDDGKYEEALPYLEQLTEVNKAPRWIYTLAGQCYRQLGRAQKSEEALAKAGPPFVDWPDPMYSHIPNLIAGKAELAAFAMHLYKASGPAKAKPFLVRAFKINPAHVNVRVALSIALQSEGQLDLAKKLLEKLQGEPNTNFWKQYAGICIERKEFIEAKEHITKAIALDSKDGNAHDIAAVIEKEQGNDEDASFYWEQAGRLYSASENWKKAELSLAFAEENGELSPEGLQTLALAQIELDHFMQARTTIQNLLKKDPSNEKVLELQSRLPTE